MSVFLTRVQVTLYVGVPSAFFYEQLVHQHDAYGQSQIDRPRSRFQEVIDGNERSCFTESFEEILYNADSLGIDSVVVYPAKIEWTDVPVD